MSPNGNGKLVDQRAIGPCLKNEVLSLVGISAIKGDMRVKIEVLSSCL